MQDDALVIICKKLLVKAIKPMLEFTAVIKQFEEKGEKTNWTYIDIPAEKAQVLKPGTKKAFRVKGHLDNVAISGIALTPMGGGDYILALKLALRKALHKSKGALLQVRLEADEKELSISEDLISCLQDEPDAWTHFSKLPKSRQAYYSNWINSAKTDATKAKRIAAAVKSLALSIPFGDMLRSMKRDNEMLRG